MSLDGESSPQLPSWTTSASLSQEPALQSEDLDIPNFSDGFPTPSQSFFDLESTIGRRSQGSALSHVLWKMYFSTFERRYVTWLGNSCKPNSGTVRSEGSIVRQVLLLDASSQKNCEPYTSPYLPQVTSTLLQPKLQRQKSDTLLDIALRFAIYSYAIRWLPLRSASRMTGGQELLGDRDRQEDVRTYMWHQAKQAIYPALTRPSFRSILALLLFTLSEMPTPNEDPGFAQLCNQALFGHVNSLRSPLVWILNTNPAETGENPLSGQALQGTPILRGQRTLFDDHESDERNNIFWLCVVSGCNRALLQQQSSLILPANAGDEEVWGFIRQRTEIFQQSFHTLRDSQDPLAEGVVEVVLQHASACKTMYVGIINQLCDSLFYHKLLPVEKTAQNVLDEVTRFREVFDHLLAMIARDYMYLNEACRLNYLLLVCHYHLATLVLADMVDTIDMVPQPLKHPSLSRLRACQAIVNTLSLCLMHDRYSDSDSPYRSQLLLDPTPELMVEVMLRTGNAVLLMLSHGEVSIPTAETMLSIIFDGLKVLAEISKKASVVLSILRNVCLARKLRIVDEQLRREVLTAPVADLALLTACNTDFIKGFLGDVREQVTAELITLDEIVTRHEQKTR